MSGNVDYWGWGARLRTTDQEDRSLQKLAVGSSGPWAMFFPLPILN